MYKHICPPSVVSPCLKRLLVILEKTPRGHIQKPRTDRLQRPKSEAPSPASGGPFAECIVPLKPSFVEEIAKNRPAVSAGRGQQMSCDCPVGCPRKNLHAGIDSAARLARFQERTPLCQLQNAPAAGGLSLTATEEIKGPLPGGWFVLTRRIWVFSLLFFAIQPVLQICGVV